jgi:hypothetical protein
MSKRYSESGMSGRRSGALPRGRLTDKETLGGQGERPAPFTFELRPRPKGGGPWGNQGFPHALDG